MIFTPCARHGVEPQVAASILYQDFQGYFDWLCTRENPHKGRDGYLNLQIACAKMKRIAMAEGYDWVWMVESDTVPPTNALRRLIETARGTQAEIVTGLYVLRHGAHVPNLFSCKDAGRNLGSGMTWHELAQVETNVIRVSGGCTGCVLIRPSALDFDFEIWKLPIDRPNAAPDMEWMRHNWRKGRVTMARLDVRCGHIEPNGNILKVEDFL